MSKQAIKRILFVGTLILLAVLFLFLFGAGKDKTKTSPEVLALAECLTEKGVKMYGADWCPHCQEQKNLFGAAFKKVDYIECQQQLVVCQQANIKAFPTWVFPDGIRIEGVLSLERLSRLSGCPFNP